MTLCKNCQSISRVPFRPEAGWEEVYRHDAKSLDASVKAGCFVCTKFRASLTAEHDAVIASAGFEGIPCSIIRTQPHVEGRQAGSISFTLGEQFYDCGGSTGVSNMFTILKPDGFSNFHNMHMTENTGSEPSFSTIREWLNRCESHHKDCRQPNPSWLPTRLVDVQGFDDGIIRLVETKTFAKGPHPYVALSHCWGKRQFLVTTRDTKARFETGVKISELPPNFRDAIYATRKLGFRYIWVDSLCIIQKSPDWLKEAPLMNKVYRNSTLTLAAAASPDAFGGLFKARDPEMVAPHKFSVQMSPNSSALSKLRIAPDDFWVTAVREAPLHTRAWVVQERALSPRTVNFCDGQLFWECRELEACEAFPDGIPQLFFETADAEYESNGFKRWESAVARVRRGNSTDGEKPRESAAQEIAYRSIYEVWEMILRDYARCGLTQSSDRFVAISGVVREFKGLLKDEYLAGLWRRNFINGLLWHVSELYPVNPTSRPPEYRAPTWSWASIETHPIDMPIVYQLQRNYADILEVSVKPKADDPYGEVAEAQMTIRGYLVKIRRPTIFRMFAQTICGQFFPDVDDEIGDDQLFAVPLREDRPQDYDSLNALWGIVLARVLTQDPLSQRHTYRRVGAFCLPAGNPLQYVGQLKPGGVDRTKSYEWFDTRMDKTVLTIV